MEALQSVSPCYVRDRGQAFLSLRETAPPLAEVARPGEVRALLATALGIEVSQVSDSAPATARALLSSTDAELAALGLSESQADRVRAMIELVRQSAEPLARGTPFRDAADIFRAFLPRVRDLKLEQFWCILLDGKHRVIREVLVSQGTLTSSPVHPREVFAPAIRHSAAAVVFIHNHPSGDPTPSADDLDITRRLSEVGDLCGIRVLDHVVIGDGAYVSLAARGLLR
jgi:DNA repair protein RadC